MSSLKTDIKEGALDCKAEHLSRMVVYYRKYNMAKVTVLQLDKGQLDEARIALRRESNENRPL